MKILLMLALAVAVPLSAQAAAPNAPVKAETKDAFETMVRNVRTEMEPGGQYAYVKPDERDKVESGLAQMQALFDKNESVQAMSADQKIALFNAQEAVNAILNSRDRDRLICERGAVPGSRIVSTSCHTYGQIEALQQASQKLMQEKIAAPCSSLPCKGG
jgi:hypothetical protein